MRGGMVLIMTAKGTEANTKEEREEKMTEKLTIPEILEAARTRHTTRKKFLQYMQTFCPSKLQRRPCVK